MDSAFYGEPSLALHLKNMNEFGIWTGGYVSKTMDALNSTSFIGGLRYWSEALLRAENRNVCTIDRCSYDPKKSHNLCDSCKLFGCTGISRAFSLQIKQHTAIKEGKKDRKITLDEYKYINNKNEQIIPTYYTKIGYCGDFDLKLSVLRPSFDDKSFTLPHEVLTSLYLMLEYGTLGAYDQYGCGVVDFKNSNERDLLFNIAKK